MKGCYVTCILGIDGGLLCYLYFSYVTCIIGIDGGLLCYLYFRYRRRVAMLPVF